MREIEFRGQTNSGRWIYGSLVYSESIQPAIYFEVGRGKVKAMDWAYVKPTSIGQFTGLYDKNGKRIYELDVLRESETGRSVAIEWKDFQWGFVYTRNDFGYVWPNHTENFEVIGNIHDNPELIKQ